MLKYLILIFREIFDLFDAIKKQMVPLDLVMVEMKKLCVAYKFAHKLSRQFFIHHIDNILGGIVVEISIFESVLYGVNFIMLR